MMQGGCGFGGNLGSIEALGQGGVGYKAKPAVREGPVHGKQVGECGPLLWSYRSLRDEHTSSEVKTSAL